MKQVIIWMVLVFRIMTKLSAQVIVNGVNLDDRPDIQYIEVTAYQKFAGKRYNAFVDYGQKLELFGAEDQMIRGNDGKLFPFETPMAVLNFFAAYGWELVQVVPKENVPFTFLGTIFLLRRSKKDK